MLQFLLLQVEIQAAMDAKVVPTETKFKVQQKFYSFCNTDTIDDIDN